MYTSAMHFWYCINLLNTPLYIHVLSPVVPNLSAVRFVFPLLLREKPDGDCQRVCHAIWPFSICVFVCVLCVCVSIEIIRATTTWTETEETNGLLTAEAETLVEGISETVSVLAWGVTRWLRRTGRQKNEKKKEEGDYQDVIPNSGRGFMSFPCARWGSQRGGGGVGVCVCLCVTGSVYPSYQTGPGCGRILVVCLGVEMQGGDWPTLRWRGGRERNKCLAFDSSMTGSDWLDQEMSLW